MYPGTFVTNVFGLKYHFCDLDAFPSNIQKIDHIVVFIFTILRFYCIYSSTNITF